MNKKLSYEKKSNQKCHVPECDNLLKENVVARKAPGSKIPCFKCAQKSQENTSNPIRTAREIRQKPSLRSAKRRERGIPLRGGHHKDKTLMHEVI